MSNGDRADLRQSVHAFESLQHAAGVRPHQAVVIEAKVRSNGAGVPVKNVVRAVVETEGIAGVENSSAVVEGKNRVRPVKVGGTDEFETMVGSAFGVDAEIQLITRFNRP